MFAADSDLQVRSRFAALLHGNLHQLAHAFLIDGGKRIALQNAALNVSRQKLADVIARESISRLRKVVGAKAEELSIGRDLISHRTSARQLDHRPDKVINFSSLLFEDLFSHLADDGALVLHLLRHADQRDHDFRKNFYSG